jgi:uncharacterized protein
MRLRALAAVLILSLTVFSQQPAGEQFYQPIREGNITALRALIKQHGTAVTDSRRQTPLMLAAAFGTVEAMQVLIDAGAAVNPVSASGLTALHLSAGDIRKASMLVQHGADVNARSLMGRTPLIVASATHGASDVVRLLLEKGGDIQVADTSGITPLISAAAANDTTTAREP